MRRLVLSKSLLVDYSSAFLISWIVVQPFLGAFLGAPAILYIVPVVGLGALVGVRIARGPTPVPPGLRLSWLVLTALVIWLLSTGAWARLGGYGENAMLLLTMWATASVVSLSVAPRVLSAALGFITLGASLAVLTVARGYLEAGDLSGYGTVVSQDYLTASQLIGTGAVGAGLAATTAGRARWMWGGLALVCLVGVSISLARGALLFSVGLILAGGSVYVLSSQPWARSILLRPGIRPRRLLVLVVLTGVPIVGLFVALRIERTAQRLLRLFSGRELAAGGRGDLWESTIDGIARAPFAGHGLGAHDALSGSISSYPHNLFLQVWADGGLPALVLLGGWLLVPLLSIVIRWRRSHPRYWLPFLGMYLFQVLEYSKSSNFYSGRTLIVIGILTAASTHYERIELPWATQRTRRRLAHDSARSAGGISRHG